MTEIRQLAAQPRAARAVLEVVAGTAQKYGIRPGDRVGHPLFGTKQGEPAGLLPPCRRLESLMALWEACIDGARWTFGV